MKSYEDQLRVVLRFVEDDLTSIREGALLDLQSDLALIAGVSRKDWTKPILSDLQKQARFIIEIIAAHNARESGGQVREDGESYLFPPGKPDAAIFWSYQDGHFTPKLPSSVRRATVDVSTSTNRFLWTLCAILSQIDATRVRICWEECRKLFYAEHGNQWFHAQSCANRAKLKRFRSQS